MKFMKPDPKNRSTDKSNADCVALKTAQRRR
jgi:hypothetical protein